MDRLFKFLKEHNISYERHDHPPVFTVEESRRLVPPLPGAKTKNLFLRDNKGKRYFLVVMDSKKRIDLKGMQYQLNVGRLSFGSPELLEQCLGVTPGAVSLFAVVNDATHTVEVLMDRALSTSSSFQFHPLENTSTLVISKKNLMRFLTLTGHQVRFINIPS